MITASGGIRCQAWSSSGRGQILGGAEALAPLLGGPDRRDHRGRQRLAGLDVPGVVLQHLRPEDPHLVDLAGVLDEIARHVGAGQPRVGDLGEQAVQGVAELVEQRADLVQLEQGRFAGGRPRQVEHVEHDRQRLQQERLVDEVAHPGAAALALAGEVVAEEQPDRRAVGVADLPDPDVGVVADEVGPRHHLDAVQPGRRVEDTVVQHPLQVEIRPQGGGVDVILLGPDPLGVVRPVPGRELDAVPRGDLREQRRLGVGVRHRRADQVRRGIRRWPRWS